MNERQASPLTECGRIAIVSSPVADTRTCDYTKVTKEQLAKASDMHISDVVQALATYAHALQGAADVHDADKLDDIDGFHRDFLTGFKQTTWWDNHRRIWRHHLGQPDGVPDDVTLLDVLEYVADCVMAGMARSGSVDKLELPAEVLERAFQNTVAQLTALVTVVSTKRGAVRSAAPAFPRLPNGGGGA